MPRRNIDIDEILYPCWNTVKFDGTPDLHPFAEGKNLVGPRIPQYEWDMDKGRNKAEPAFYIEPGGRMKLGKQEQFYRAIFQYPEVFYGGAAGGAKSDALMKSHVVKHLDWAARGITGENTAMFCETKEELERRHIINLHKRIPSYLGWYDAQKMIFHFYKKFGGGTIMFLYIGHRKKDIERLLSYEFAYITIDELTRNTEYIYQFITSRLRSTLVPAHEWCVASASNPGSVGHKWVYERFVNIRTRKLAEAYKGERRCFIQALASENPLLPKEYYENILAKLPPKVQNAYRNANWKIYEGQFYDMLDETVHIIPYKRPPDEVVKYRGIDHGTSHPTGCVWVAHYPPTEEYPNGRLVIYRYYEKKDKWSTRHKANIYELGKRDKNLSDTTPLSHDAFSNKGSSEGDLTVAERYNANDEYGSFGVIRANRDRKLRWRALLDLLSWESHVEVKEDGTMERIIDRMPQLQFMDTPEVRMLFEELQGLIHKDGDSEDVQKLSGNEYDVGQGDEGPDCLGYCILGIGPGELVMTRDDEPELRPWDPFRDKREKEQRYYGYAEFG